MSKNSARLARLERARAAQRVPAAPGMIEEQQGRARARIIARLDAVTTDAERDRVYGILAQYGTPSAAPESRREGSAQ